MAGGYGTHDHVGDGTVVRVEHAAGDHQAIDLDPDPHAGDARRAIGDGDRLRGLAIDRVIGDRRALRSMYLVLVGSTARERECLEAAVVRRRRDSEISAIDEREAHEHARHGLVVLIDHHTADAAGEAELDGDAGALFARRDRDVGSFRECAEPLGITADVVGAGFSSSRS